MAQKLGFYFDQTLCNGCKACQIACKDKHDNPIGVNWRRVVEYTGGDWRDDGETQTHNVFSYYTSISCNHCEDAICMRVCPTTAMSRHDDGTVYVDENKCVGCRYCEWASSPALRGRWWSASPAVSAPRHWRCPTNCWASASPPSSCASTPAPTRTPTGGLVWWPPSLPIAWRCGRSLPSRTPRWSPSPPTGCRA